MFNYEENGIVKGVQGKNKRYVNYHHHTYYSNPIAGADSPISPISVIKRTIELGHTTVTSCEHGSSLSFLEYYGYIDYVKKDNNGNIKVDFRNKFNLVFAVEAYFVIDNLVKDRTNAHIVLIAKNDNGRRAINRLCSNANEFGFYGRPRASLKDIMELPAEDIIVTTACLAGVWRYDQPFNPYQDLIDDYNNFKTTFEKIEESDTPEDIISLCFKDTEEYEEKRKNYEFVKNNPDVSKTYDYISILKMWKEHFKDNLYLEIQPHNTEKQIKLNNLIKQVSKELDIPIIAGCDSHANTEKDVQTREIFIFAKKDDRPEDEVNWYVDFPDYETLKQRFLEQGIFSEKEIEDAIDRTLIVETCEQPYISKDIKLPTIYPNLTQDERNKLFEDLIWELWEKRKEELIEFNKKWYDKEEVVPFSRYVKEIEKELDVVIGTNMTDYFLFNYHMIKNAVEKYGGVLTKTGRGCFTENSYVLTSDGEKKISDVNAGDLVYNRYGVIDKVVGTPTYAIDETMIRIHFKEKFVELTKDHRVLVLSSFGKVEYKKAKDITYNDFLLELDDESYIQEYNPIKIDKMEEFDYIGYVYDLTMENDPSFTVNGIIVHNSGGSFYLNNLLGFTSIDRIFEKVPMLSERFMSKSRILETRSLPDIDHRKTLKF